MKTSSMFTAVLLAAAGGVLAGCAEPVADDDVPIVTGLEAGYLTVAWTINGAATAEQCAANGVTGFHIDIYDEDGYWVLDRSVPCDLFTMGMRLVEGTYYAEASLLGDDGFVVSPIQRDESFIVLPDDEVTILIDFPLVGEPTDDTPDDTPDDTA